LRLLTLILLYTNTRVLQDLSCDICVYV
jgi:hypothetical protein